jgi:CRP/FNR family transcriptional regulator, cyclic AMP receptor protein
MSSAPPGTAPPAALSPEALPDELLRRMAKRGNTRQFGAQTVLFTEGDDSDSIYILLAGRVKVYGADAEGKEVIYNTLGAGETFGELAFDGGRRSASVMTLEPCKLIVVPGAEARAFLAEHPDFAWFLVRKFAALLRRATQSVKSLALQDVYGRLADALRALADAEGVIEPKPTQQELAERVGSSREMVSRILTQLVKGGYLDSSAKRLTLTKKLPDRW